MYWTRLTKTADVGSNIIHLEEAVDWRTGDEIVIAPTSFEPYDTEIVRIGKIANVILVLNRRCHRDIFSFVLFLFVCFSHPFNIS